MRSATPRTLVLVALVATFGCRGEEGRQVRGAVEDFIDFGMSNEERAKAPPTHDNKLLPHLPERSRQVKQLGRKGTVLWVELDMPHQLEADEVVATLEFEVDRLLEQTDYPDLEVRGMPGGLLVYGKVMGGASIKRTNEGIQNRRVWASVRDDQPTLTRDQHQALVALELEIAVLGRRGKAKALKSVRRTHGKELVNDAIKIAKRRWGPQKRARRKRR